MAAILASAYDFDVPDAINNYSQLDAAESLAYLDSSVQDDDDEDYESSKDSSLPHASSFEYSDVGSSTMEHFSQSNNTQQNIQSQSRLASNLNSLRQRDLQRLQLARNRHRKRRYDILSKFLLSAAELLQLEKSQARAFLPMLARLLVPEPPKEFQSVNGQSSRKAAFWPRRTMRNLFSENSDQESAQVGLSQQALQSGIENDFQMDYLLEQLEDDETLTPFLESLSPGAGFRCLSMLLLQHLLHCKEGYDARVRHVIKKLGVLVLVQEMRMDEIDLKPDENYFSDESPSINDLLTLATRNFESLEHCIASRILELSAEQQSSSKATPTREKSGAGDGQQKGLSREQIVRGLKIGSVGLVAGTLFAVTGGLAAPGIAAGIAAIAGSAATAAAVATLTSTAAVTAVFGVGGGSLAAYKMQRRTQGVTEFEFQKENSRTNPRLAIEAELFSTICLSGWLRDRCDFQRPWGVTPRNPPLPDRLEALERFYSVYKPDNVTKCSKILASWKGEEKELWKLLREKYGRDPDHLFPLVDGPCFRGKLTLDQQEVLDQLFVELGYVRSTSGSQPSTPLSRAKSGFRNRFQSPGLPKQDVRSQSKPIQTPVKIRDSRNGMFQDSLHGPVVDAPASVATPSSTFDTPLNPFAQTDAKKDPNNDLKPPNHLTTVWDYHANYGGELYTVKWESNLLTELCDSIADMALDVVSGATTQLLKHTAFSTLLSAVVWPFALINLANMIDGTWTLAIERSDEAGKELARSLLFSQAGHRPVTLVGFSFGGRAIYSCLKELARYQEKWEDHQEKMAGVTGGGRQSVFDNMREPASIVEDVIFMGLPNHLSLASWAACRQIVSGRLVNCYSRRDLILSLMFQYKRLSGGLKPVCGTCPVTIPGVENVDVTDLISGHQDYCLFVGDILRRVRHCQPLRSPGNVTVEVNEIDNKQPNEHP